MLAGESVENHILLREATFGSQLTQPASQASEKFICICHIDGLSSCYEIDHQQIVGFDG